jgi:centromere protein C
MAPRGSSIGASSPARAASHPIARRLDFEQDESSLQETPALSGSGARRGKRNDVYDIPEDGSPVPQQDTILEESLVQEEITANEDSVVINTMTEESFAAQIGDDTTTGAEATEDVIEQEESEIAPEPVKEPAKRGRKRKSDVLEPLDEAETTTSRPQKRGPTTTKASETQKKGKKAAAAPPVPRRRSQRVSDIAEQDPSILDALLDSSVGASEQVEEAPVAPKRRGRPARVQPDTGKENAAPAKTAKTGKTTSSKEKEKEKEKDSATFKKPAKPIARSKDKPESKSKPENRAKEKTPLANDEDAGKLVDVHGRPLSKQDIEKMSTTSTTSRFGRGRHLSVFREMDPDAVARIGRTGRHRVAPIDFWKNESISYDTDGSMTAIVKNQDPEPERKAYKTSANRGRKRTLAAIEEEEVELDPWEEDEGTLVGNYRDYDPVTDLGTNDIIEDSTLSSVLQSVISLLTLSSNRLG